jgi:hypothetical protein
MSSPDYIQQVAVPRGARVDQGAGSTAFGTFFQHSSVPGLAWAATDLLLICLTSYLALMFRANVGMNLHWYSLSLYREPMSMEMFLDFAWFGLCWVLLARSFGLYLPIQHMSGLHEGCCISRAEWRPRG